MRSRFSTLRLLVAKWLCHNSVSRSPSGSGLNEHAEDPPRFQPRGIVGSHGGVGQERGGRLEILGNTVPSRFAFEQAADAGLGPVSQVALQLVPGRGEPGAAVEVDDPPQVPGGLGIGTIGSQNSIGSLFSICMFMSSI